VVIRWAEIRVEYLERFFERSIENGDPHVEGGLHRPSVPAHLLLLDHAASHDLIDRAPGEGGRDWLAMPPASTVID